MLMYIGFCCYGLALASHLLCISGLSCLGCLWLEPASCVPGLLQVSWEAYIPGCGRPPGNPLYCEVFIEMWMPVVCCPGLSVSLGRSSDCEIFRGAWTPMICCPGSSSRSHGRSSDGGVCCPWCNRSPWTPLVYEVFRGHTNWWYADVKCFYIYICKENSKQI